MAFYLVFPSAPLTSTVVAHVEGDPNLVTSAEFEFDVLPRHEVFERFGAFAVSKSLADELRRHSFTGCHLGTAVASVAEGVTELSYSDLPEIECLAIVGTPGVDDFGVDGLGFLTVSERIFEILRRRDPTIEEDARLIGDGGKPVRRR